MVYTPSVKTGTSSRQTLMVVTFPPRLNKLLVLPRRFVSSYFKQSEPYHKSIIQFSTLRFSGTSSIIRPAVPTPSPTFNTRLRSTARTGRRTVFSRRMLRLSGRSYRITMGRMISSCAFHVVSIEQWYDHTAYTDCHCLPICFGTGLAFGMRIYLSGWTMRTVRYALFVFTSHRDLHEVYLYSPMSSST